MFSFFQEHHLCLATVLRYSPRTMQRLQALLQGRDAYVVGGVPHLDDLAVADELQVPFLGSEPAVAQLYSTKSGSKRIFASAGVPTPPGEWDIHSREQVSWDQPWWITVLLEMLNLQCLGEISFLSTFVAHSGLCLKPCYFLLFFVSFLTEF